MSIIKSLGALEILDSRGRPTVQVRCVLESGVVASASVPSGASTGRAEALELRDGDKSRYGGLGCRKAVQNVTGEIARSVHKKPFATQADLDRHLLEVDGTANKARLGANAVLGVSLAFSRAQAAENQVPLYRHFADMIGAGSAQLPRLTLNLFSGGKHAGGQVAIQDVLVVPNAATVADSLAMTYAVVQSAAELVRSKYDTRPLKADEGGFAPGFVSEEAMIEDALRAIEGAGLVPGKDMALAIDVASSHFYKNGRYSLGDQQLSGEEMVDRLETWLYDYPIVSLEDGLAEEDWTYWTQLKASSGNRALILGDDFLCTNPDRIRRAVDADAANALLLKVNQIGTLTEAAEALQLARSSGWQVVVSARSGETEDDWLADLATGWQGDFIKVGSLQQSERLAKYNRLLAIEADAGLTFRSRG